MKSQTKKPPAAPAAYRPQPTPRVLQTKMATTPQGTAPRRTVVAPPAYRPQSTPRCLQLKSAGPRSAAPKLAHGPARPRSIVTPSKGTIQRFAWALHDSDDMEKSAVVDKNLERAQSRYVRAETITDANKKIGKLTRTLLNQGEAIHLHAHGAEDRLANLGTATLANILKAKFGLEGLAGRVIVMHSCNTGQLTYARDLLAKLVEFGNTDRVNLTGTTVYAPENYLVVESDGLSYVAKRGVGLGDLRIEPRTKHLQPLGAGWNAWTVNGSGDVVPTDSSGVVAVMQIDEKTLKPKPEGKHKVEDKPKGKKGKLKVEVDDDFELPIRIGGFGYYDDPRQLSAWEEAFIKRAFRSKSYPPQ